MSPPLGRLLPNWSLAWTVMTEPVPSTLTVVGRAVIVVLAGSAAPAVKVTSASPLVMAAALIVPLTVSVPVRVSVRVAL